MMKKMGGRGGRGRPPRRTRSQWKKQLISFYEHHELEDKVRPLLLALAGQSPVLTTYSTFFAGCRCGRSTGQVEGPRGQDVECAAEEVCARPHSHERARQQSKGVATRSTGGGRSI